MLATIKLKHISFLTDPVYSCDRLLSFLTLIVCILILTYCFIIAATKDIQQNRVWVKEPGGYTWTNAEHAGGVWVSNYGIKNVPSVFLGNQASCLCSLLSLTYHFITVCAQDKWHGHFWGGVMHAWGWKSWNKWEVQNVLNVFIDIQTSKELIQMDTDKMMNGKCRMHGDMYMYVQYTLSTKYNCFLMQCSAKACVGTREEQIYHSIVSILIS